jgi:16S rRNA processing protein RimM
MSRRWVPVAEVARPHGVRGELRLKLYNEGSDLLLRPRAVKLRLPDGEERDARIAAARAVSKALLVTVVDVEDRDQAEALRDALVCVPRDEFPPLDAGEFYACDVEGARVVLPTGDEVGRVQALESYPSCDVLVVRRDGERPPLEIPLTEAFVETVDVDAGVVRLVTLDGL